MTGCIIRAREGEVASAAMTAMKPGFWESMIPIWGSIRGIEDNISNGEYKTSLGLASLAANVVFLGMDVCMVGGLARGIGALGESVAKGLLRDGAEQIAKDAIEVGVRDAVEAGARDAGESGLKELGEVAGREVKLVGEEIGATLGKDEGERVLETCLEGSGNCFAGDTEVVVGVAADGTYVTKPIADIQVGDTVLTRDQNNPDGPLVQSPVVGKVAYQVDHLRVLVVRGADGTEEVIRTTDFHPFFVDGGGWVEAVNLQPGDTLCGPDGQNLTVLGSAYESLDQPVTVYNLSLQQDHTYFVAGGDGIAGASDAVWVHNACGGAIGAAHGAEEHIVRTNEIVADLVKSEKYEQIYINRSLRTVVGGTVDSLKRPDIIGVLKNGGGYDLFEIVSKSQRSSDMWKKIDFMESLLGNLAGPGSNVFELF